MRKSILNINQKAALEIGLDLTDLTLIDWFQMFISSGKMEFAVNEKNELFYWTSFKKVIEDLPLLGIKERTVSTRFKKLVERGVFDTFTSQTRTGKKAFFRLKKEAYKALYEEEKAMSVSTDMGGKKGGAMSVQTDMPMSVSTDMDCNTSTNVDILHDKTLRIVGEQCDLDNRISSAQLPEKKEKVFIEIPLREGVYEVTEKEVQKHEEIYPAVDVKQSYRNMVGWCNSVEPHERKTKKGVKRFINSWLRGDQAEAAAKKSQKQWKFRNEYQARYRDSEHDKCQGGIIQL